MEEVGWCETEPRDASSQQGEMNDFLPLDTGP